MKRNFVIATSSSFKLGSKTRECEKQKQRDQRVEERFRCFLVFYISLLFLMPDLDSILSFVNQESRISDVHLAGNDFIMFRYNGEIIKQEQYGKIPPDVMEQMVLTSMNGDIQKFNNFKETKDEDYSYISKEGVPYRVNAFFRRGQMALVMRKVNGKAIPLEKLMFPDIVESIKTNVLSRKKGLYLVTGPTGSGKSTSLVAMIEYLNQTRQEHILTLEDPIEFIFEPKGCSISQRNIGTDTKSFHNALRAAMREDPDIILVGEIRDHVTAEAALNMAETGHFVFATLHTSSCPATVNRYISFFPPEIQESVCDRLANALVGVQSQMLVRSLDGGRCGVYEIMINTTAVRNNIKKREIPQLKNVIETSAQQGMISMRAYAERLLNEGRVSPEQVSFIFADEGSR